MERNNELLSHILKARSGDQESFESIRKSYAPLIEACVRKHTVSGMNAQDVEDLRQEALVVLYRAVCSYDLDERGVEFGLYAKICVDNGLSSFVRAFNRANRGITVPLEDESYTVDADYLQSVIDGEQAAELVRTVKKHLSDYESKIWWRYVSGKSVSAIAAEIGAPSAKSVSNAIYRIRKKLRSVISEQ